MKRKIDGGQEEREMLGMQKRRRGRTTRTIIDGGGRIGERGRRKRRGMENKMEKNWEYRQKKIRERKKTSRRGEGKKGGKMTRKVE
jgi:hypothetical protein